MQRQVIKARAKEEVGKFYSLFMRPSFYDLNMNKIYGATQPPAT